MSAAAARRASCGWCKDKWGISWQITPRVLTDALAIGGVEAKRAFDAMMTMQKIDVAKSRRREGGEFLAAGRPHIVSEPADAKALKNATRATVGGLR